MSYYNKQIYIYADSTALGALPWDFWLSVNSNRIGLEEDGKNGCTYVYARQW